MNLTPEVTWIAPCTTVDGAHMHISVYLLGAGNEHVLVDTGSVVHRDAILGELEREVGDDELDALLLSHTDLPHAGNLSAIDARWPDCEVWCGSNHPESHGLPERTETYDETNRIAGRRFHVIDPILKDRTNTNWLFDERSGVLFTSDGFGYHHAPDECNRTLGQLREEGRYAVENVYEFHRTSLPWLRYADPVLLRREIDSVLDEHDVTYVAPSHSPPIPSEEIEQYLTDFDRVVTRLVDEYAQRRARG